MTEQELKEIEERLRYILEEKHMTTVVDGVQFDMSKAMKKHQYTTDIFCQDVPRLIATLREMEQKIRGYEIAADIAEEQLSVRGSTVARLREMGNRLAQAIIAHGQISADERWGSGKWTDYVSTEEREAVESFINFSPSANRDEFKGHTTEHYVDEMMLSEANSGEKPWTQEEIDSAKKRASVTVANFRIDPPGFSELELLRELETALRAWRYAQLWNAQDLRRANDAMDKLDALRKSDAPGEE